MRQMSQGPTGWRGVWSLAQGPPPTRSQPAIAGFKEQNQSLTHIMFSPLRGGLL